MNRRGFLRSILAAGIAPYVVTTAGVLMPIRQHIVTPDYWLPGGIIPSVIGEADTVHFSEEEYRKACMRLIRWFGQSNWEPDSSLPSAKGCENG